MNANLANKFEKIKETWYYSSPPRLYDLCVDKLVKNLDILLVKNDTNCNRNRSCSNLRKQKDSTSVHLPSTSIDASSNLLGKHAANDSKSSTLKSSKKSTHHQKSEQNSNTNEQKQISKIKSHRACYHLSSKSKKNKCNCYSHRANNAKKYSLLKYRLRDTIGPIPNCICQSIIVEYSKYYLSRVERHERNQYFQIENISNKEKPRKSIKNIKLITYYDLIMAFASRAEKCNLNTIDYRQCIWSHSTLDERIKTKNKNKPVRAQSDDDAAEKNVDSYDSSDLDENQMPKSLRSKQKSHLSDADLRTIVRSQKNLYHLDTCPCMLTNKSILLINKYLANNLKSLRFQNCCNWHHSNNQLQQQEAERNPNLVAQQGDNQLGQDTLLELRSFMETDEDDDDDDDDEDDDDDDDDDDQFYHGISLNNRLNVDSNDHQETSERNDYFSMRPYLLNTDTNGDGECFKIFLFLIWLLLNLKDFLIHKVYSILTSTWQI
jgi:hypothetical protein